MGSIGRNVTNPMRKVADATTRGLGSSAPSGQRKPGQYIEPQGALMFKDGQAYSRTGGNRAGSRKMQVSPSPYQYQPLGFTAQEAGYFGPGRYGAAKRYGEDSVTNPNVPQLGNYYPAGSSYQIQSANQVPPMIKKGSPKLGIDMAHHTMF